MIKKQGAFKYPRHSQVVFIFSCLGLVLLGSGTSLVTVGPAKVKAFRSILSIEVKINMSNSYDPKYVCIDSSRAVVV